MTAKGTPLSLRVAWVFVIGRQGERHSALIAQEVRDGMAVGSRGTLRGRSAEQVAAEVACAGSAIMGAGAPAPRAVRHAGRRLPHWSRG